MKKTNIIIFAVIIFTGVLGIIFIALGIRTSVKTVAASTYTASGGLVNKNYEITDDVKEVYIEANTIQFEIREDSSVKNIDIAIIDFFTESDMNFSVSGNKLFIKSLDTSPIAYGKQVLTHPKVIITIPDSTYFTIFEIDSRVSDLLLSSIKTEKLRVRNDAGKLVLNNVNASSINVENNVGMVNITLISNSKDISVENRVGDVNINTDDITKYKYNVKNNLGSVNVGGNSYTGLQNDYSSDKGEENIRVSNKLGNVSIM